MATEFEFDLPRGFGPIPLDPDPHERAARARRILGALGPDAPVELAKAVDGLVMGGQLMLDAGARVAGQLTLADEAPDVSATFVLAIKDLPAGLSVSGEESARMAVAAMAAQLQARHPDSDVRGGELTCGPAVVLVRAGEYRLPAEQMRTGQPVVAPSYSLQIMIPDPDGDRMIVLDLSTHHTEQWRRFVEQAEYVAQSITFAAAA